MWGVNSTRGHRVQSIDTPLRRARRGPSTNIPRPTARPTIIPQTAAATGDAVDEVLPPNWEARTTPKGKICEKLNCGTCPIVSIVSCIAVGAHYLAGMHSRLVFMRGGLAEWPSRRVCHAQWSRATVGVARSSPKKYHCDGAPQLKLSITAGSDASDIYLHIMCWIPNSGTAGRD